MVMSPHRVPACLPLPSPAHSPPAHSPQDNDTALHFAAHKNHTAIGEMLIAAGASVNARNDRGRTPSISASCEGSVEFLELLLRSGADKVRGWQTGRQWQAYGE